MVQSKKKHMKQTGFVKFIPLTKYSWSIFVHVKSHKQYCISTEMGTCKYNYKVGPY